MPCLPFILPRLLVLDINKKVLSSIAQIIGERGGAPLSNATQVVEGDNLVHACCVVDVSADVDVDVDIDIDVDANLIMIV